MGDDNVVVACLRTFAAFFIIISVVLVVEQDKELLLVGLNPCNGILSVLSFLIEEASQVLCALFDRTLH